MHLKINAALRLLVAIHRRGIGKEDARQCRPIPKLSACHVTRFESIETDPNGYRLMPAMHDGGIVGALSVYRMLRWWIVVKR